MSKRWDDRGVDAPELARRVRWYVLVRWFFLLALGLSGNIPQLLGQGINSATVRDVLIMFAALAYNGVLYLFAKRKNASIRYSQMLGMAQIGLDILLITGLIYAHGGIESRAIVAYAIPILAGRALFGTLGSRVTATASAVLYDLMLLGDWFHILPSAGIEVPQWHLQGAYLVTSIMFYSAALIIISFMGDFIQSLLGEAQRKAEARAQALDDAQAIAHLGSWEWNPKTNEVQWSKELYRQYGLDPATTKPTLEAALNAIHPDDRNEIQGKLTNAVKTKQPFETEGRVVRPDKTMCYVRGQGRVTLDEDGEVIKVTGTALDITSLREAESAAHQKADELERFNALMVGRELKMADMKKKIRDLEGEKK